MRLTYSSVRCCTSVCILRCSSCEISASFSRRRSSSTPSRRMLRTDTRACSAYFAVTRVSSRRRSSFKSGIGTRMTWPSVCGLSPSPASRIALSTALTMARSHTWTVIIRGSGTLTLASWLSGTVPPYAATVIGSSRLADARPVRNPPNSLRNTSPAPSIRRRRSSSNASSGMALVLRSAWSVDDGVTSSAAQNFGETPIFEDREHQNRNVVLARQRNRRGIHHPQIAGQDLQVIESFEALGARLTLGVRIINAVHLGSLQERVTTHLGGSESRCRIRRKKRVSGPGRENHDTILLEVPQRPPTDIWFADGLH